MVIDLNDPQQLTLENVRELLRSGDDSTATQIRVGEGGEAYLSKTVGAKDLEGVKFQMETFSSYAGYVGEEAANDEEWVEEVYTTLRDAWRSGYRGYVDSFADTLIRARLSTEVE